MRTTRSPSAQVHYKDMMGITQNVTSCVLGGNVKAHDADVAIALSHV